MSDTAVSGVSGTLDESDVSVNDLAEHVQTLTDHIDDLEQQIAEKDQRIDDLEATLDALDQTTVRDSGHSRTTEARAETEAPYHDEQSAIEFRGAESPSEAVLEDIWIAGHPVGIMIQNAKDRDKQFRNVLLVLAGWDRDIVDDHPGADLPDGALDDCENAASSATTSGTVSADLDHLLPIHRKTNARTTGTHDLTGNKYRATFVWPAFHSRAVKEQGKWKLSSAQVRNILDEHGLDTNRNTVRRTMAFVAKLSSEKPADERDPEDDDNLLTLKRGGSKLTLVADQDEWEDYVDGVSEHLMTKKRARQDDRLDATTSGRDIATSTQAITDGGDEVGESKDALPGEGVTVS